MQQPKVSMVMPCYNKDKYIADMFDSILAQKWDNLELLLVNDGSTDSTREIIAEYEPKFTQRGFTAIIIDQENKGVCSAAKAGFERVTGDYICTVDADDELDPEYVSTMAGWLDEHKEYDIAVCEGINYTIVGKYKNFHPFNPVEIVEDDPFLAERWLLADYRAEPWRYMVRAEYFRRCRIVDTYHTQSKGSHEPSYILPLFTHGGKLKYFPQSLYYFNVTGESHSRHRYPWQARKHFDDYLELCKIAIEALPENIVSPERKQRLIKTATIACKFRTYHGAIYLVKEKYPVSNRQILTNLAESNLDILFRELLDTINTQFSIVPQIEWDRVAPLRYLFYEMARNCLAPTAHRIVGCGALCESTSKYLPLLKGTPLEPTELWDAADGSGAVKNPDYNSLSPNDIAIVFYPPYSNSAEQILRELEKTRCAILIGSDIDSAVQRYQTFPELMQIGRPLP